MASHGIPRTGDNSVWESVKRGADLGFKFGGLAAAGYCAISGLFVSASNVSEKVGKCIVAIGVGAVLGAVHGTINGTLIGTAIGSLSKLKEKEKYIQIAILVSTASMFVFEGDWKASIFLGLVTAEYWDKGKELYNNW